MTIKSLFLECVSTLQNSSYGEEAWLKIEKKHKDGLRHYHNLLHLEALAIELLPIKAMFSDWSAVIYAISFHDIVYKTHRKDNEEKSAYLAEKELCLLGAPNNTILLCMEMINATQKHLVSSNHEINLFTDADLSILGKDWSIYEKYLKNIRKEYAIYPDILYNAGRKKVLEHFLQLPKIFKSEYFHSLYEDTAKSNIAKELSYLTK